MSCSPIRPEPWIASGSCTCSSRTPPERRTLTLDTKFRFCSSSTLSSPISAANSSDFAAANKLSRLLVEYNAADDRFDVESFLPGY